MKIASVVVFGNRAECSYCRKLDRVRATAEFREWLASDGVSVVDADGSLKPPTAYAKARSDWGLAGAKWPTVVVVSDSGRKLGSFLARSYSDAFPAKLMTASLLIAKIESLCPSCGDSQCPACGGTGKCPACGGTGKV